MPNEREQEWLNWVASRPEEIQKIIAKYPPGEYRMTKDSPYGISCPGTKVILISYSEDGKLGVVVTPENKLPEAIEHEKELLRKHNRLHKFEEITAQAVKVAVEPKYVELIKAFNMAEE